jgi:hypothetical protein
VARESKRYLGLELAGAKNHKTAIAVLEHYPKERKIFLLDIHDRLGSGDAALLETLAELRSGITKVGVNVPLELPPCITCTRKTCPLPEKCTVPAVKWMRESTRKAARNKLKTLEFTPYTQRPTELWVRYNVLSELQDHERFEIDETLGGNKAPLTARMHFIRRHLGDAELSEVWPKLSVATMASGLGLSKRVISTYRHLEEGIQSREQILEALCEREGIFIYERDVQKLAVSLAAFDAFVCALTVLLTDLGRTASPPTNFPDTSGWVVYPT